MFIYLLFAREFMMEDKLECFLKDHQGFRFNEEKTRVVCTITGHELPCNVTAIESYVNGKKYKQLTKNGTCSISKVAEYKEYLVPTKKGKNLLYCIVTKKEINNIPSHIENHVTGRKFQRDLKIYKEKGEASNQTDDKETSDADLEGKKMEATEDMDDDDMADEEEEVENKDEEIKKEEDEGFKGGIWYPDGMDLDKMKIDEDGMDMDVKNSTEEIKRIDKGKSSKNKLKRKMKDNKKNKISLAVNQKKKR